MLVLSRKNGTSGESSLEITSCFIPAGRVSTDNTGTYTYTENCPWAPLKPNPGGHANAVRRCNIITADHKFNVTTGIIPHRPRAHA